MIDFIEVKSRARTELIDITADIEDAVKRSGIGNGTCHIFVMHTTAGIMVNEGADPAVRVDISRFLDKLVPDSPHFTHGEGNSDAHIKSLLTGTSQTIFVEKGRLLLGTWQSVYFCEFDGPRTRRVALKLAGDG